MTVSVSSRASRLLDFAPFNSLNLTCASTVRERANPVPLAMETQWFQTVGLGNNPTPIPAEAFDNHRQFGSSGTSTLTLMVTEAGNNTYTCQVTMDVSPATDILNATDSVMVEVIGQYQMPELALEMIQSYLCV